jgi:hypothetical protein
MAPRVITNDFQLEIRMPLPGFPSGQKLPSELRAGRQDSPRRGLAYVKREQLRKQFRIFCKYSEHSPAELRSSTHLQNELAHPHRPQQHPPVGFLVGSEFAARYRRRHRGRLLERQAHTFSRNRINASGGISDERHVPYGDSPQRMHQGDRTALAAALPGAADPFGQFRHAGQRPPRSARPRPVLQS